MIKTSTALAFLLLATGLSAQTSIDAGRLRYERNGDRWIRHEGAHAFVVDPQVITVRSRDGEPVADKLVRVTANRRYASPARLLRSNRLGFHDILSPAGQDVMQFVRELRASGAFENVHENTLGRYVGAPPNDPSYSSLWHLHNTGQTGGTSDADVDAPEAWTINDGDASVVVAVLDSGTEWTHSDLSGNIWINSAETLNGIDSDGNGFIDDVRGWDFTNDDNDPSGAFWHGTAVASVVAAQGNNSIGVVGLAGGGCDGIGVQVMAVNVGDFFPIGSVLDDAILYAADNGADIITLSLTVGTSPAIDAAVDAAHDVSGVFLDCASGNNGPSVGYPANLPKIMAVASTNHDDNVSGFSNPGPEVEVAAPGENILMCDTSNSYLTSSGTSFASPHVAALAGLILSERPSMTNAEIRQLIIDTAEDVDAPGIDVNSGAGRINAHQALLNLPPAGDDNYIDGRPLRGLTTR